MQCEGEGGECGWREEVSVDMRVVSVVGGRR